MRSALKSIPDTLSGLGFSLHFGGEEILLDPAGVLILQSINMLVVSDLHLEKGSSFARKGQFLPPYDTGATLERLSTLVAKYNPKTVVSLGDSFHDDEACHRLDDSALGLIDTIATGRQVVWVTGNHDPSPPEHLPGECAAELAMSGITLRHIPTPDHAGHEIAGHLHPCAKISVRGKTVRRACFATDGHKLIMPSFGVLTGGLNLGDAAFANLFHHDSLKAFMMGRDRIYPVAARNITGL